MSGEAFKVQHASFRKKEKELTKEEYRKLVVTAKENKNERLSTLIQTICSTGIRVSEHRFITRETLKSGIVRIVNKGKELSVFLPKELQKRLLRYCKANGIKSTDFHHEIRTPGQPMQYLVGDEGVVQEGGSQSAESISA